ncbi:uncharacterized protein TA14370 [Theileria annulata]|uniref:Uncharacterized protein n=1 Tax=Theileria annulata TaxID=5874 RepID=Q4UF08_THEAN|nr:uncharacterized protein TA14370 [Theileria annulata]CAI74331.1 hypothetical protein TA14370 [Theileria annulata]|eukprot:XP_952063.1 hypothetical protein TA14370 [Theileria annulata]
MSSTPLSHTNKFSELKSSTGSPRSKMGFSKQTNEEFNAVPVTSEFYTKRTSYKTFFRPFLILLFSIYIVLVSFLSKKDSNSGFSLALMTFHTKVIDLYQVILDFYKRCPAVMSIVKKLRFEVPYFIKILSLYVPKYEKQIVYLSNYNTLNNWLSIFVWATFAVIFELLTAVVNNLVLSYRHRNTPRYCSNMVHPSKFHDKVFTQEQLNKLFKTREYLDLKNSRHGLGPEAWNWQLRKTLEAKHNSKSQNAVSSGDESDIST